MRGGWPMRKLVDEAFCSLIGPRENRWTRGERCRRAAVRALLLIFNFPDGCHISRLQQVKDSSVDCDFELHIHNLIAVSLCRAPLTQSHRGFDNVR